eukprot:TRINITY_DN30795_c0_g1_i1.p1 TRINITY_DN30795_c0_g1~~TRINITY_DN30795_c0_g1_i1.p1  ORF type:complete len:138 (+),score=15.01 TRINITY_DN30795_c0_g1_i1:189-602(+)
MLKNGEFSAHVRWLVTMATVAGSVFALNVLIDPNSGYKWLWMLQALTPFMTFSMLGYLDSEVRPSSGESISVMTLLGSLVSVPVLAVLYAILVALNSPGSVFYVALIAKLLLWLQGHKCILKAQQDVRSRRGHQELE